MGPEPTTPCLRAPFMPATRTTEVKRVLSECQRQWMVGVVAVNVAVKADRFLSGWSAMVAPSNLSGTGSPEATLGKASLLASGLTGTVAGAVAGNG